MAVVPVFGREISDALSGLLSFAVDSQGDGSDQDDFQGYRTVETGIWALFAVQ